MIGLKRTLLLSLALLPAASQACRAPPAALLIGVDEQIALASDVSLAEVVSATPVGDRQVDYLFASKRRLAGPAQAIFTIAGDAPAVGDKDTSFDGHTDPAFWKRGGGRVMNSSDCAMHPHFVVGATYLIFGAPATWRSYEKIDSVDGQVNLNDAWLLYVERKLRARTANAPDPALGVRG